MTILELVEQQLGAESLMVLRRTCMGVQFTQMLQSIVAGLNSQIANAAFPVDFDTPTMTKYIIAQRDLVKTRDVYQQFVDALQFEHESTHILTNF